MRETFFSRKRILLLAAILLSVSAMAQDTLSRPPDYYYHYWPQDPDTLDCIEKWGTMEFQRIPMSIEMAKECVTDRPLTIYGIAALVVIQNTPCDSDVLHVTSIPVDTALSSSFEFLRLYKRNGSGYDLTVIAEDTLVATDTFAHYFYYGSHVDYRPITMKPRRIFEKYFNTPVTVNDTFYVGITENTSVMRRYPGDSDSKRPAWMIRPILLHHYNPFGDGSCPGDMGFREFRVCNQDDWGWGGWPDGYFLFVLPIFHPEDTVSSSTDTIHEPDTLGIGLQMLERYVFLYPNPAATTTTISSSFGLSRIEVFEPSGRCVYDKPASGLSIDLDISRWPADYYIVNIYTPIGRVTRRLIVQ